MAEKRYPILDCFVGECYPLSFLKNANFISGTEEGLIRLARLRMGMLDLESVPFFCGDKVPQISYPFVALRKAGFLEHFHEDEMFKIMDALYYPMRMKILQTNVLSLTDDARKYQWQILGACLRDDRKTSLKEKEISAIFATSESLNAMRYYLNYEAEKTPQNDKLFEEYKKITTEFIDQVDGIPEFYYRKILSCQDKLYSHSDSVFKEKANDLIWNGINYFNVSKVTKLNEAMSEKEKDERILKLSELANRALFYNPYVEKKLRVKVFDLCSEFPRKMKVAYHQRELKRASKKSGDHSREE